MPPCSQLPLTAAKRRAPCPLRMRVNGAAVCAALGDLPLLPQDGPGGLCGRTAAHCSQGTQSERGGEGGAALFMGRFRQRWESWRPSLNSVTVPNTCHRL